MGGDWPLHTIAEAPVLIIDGDRGKNYPKQHDFSVSGHCLFLNAGNVTTDGFSFSKCSFISEERDHLLRKGRLERGDIVLTTRGTVGNTAWFCPSIPFNTLRINSGMVIFRANKERLLPRFLYLFVRSNLFHQQVRSLRTGSAQPQLPIRDIRRIRLPVPPLPEQRAIAHILGSLDDKIELNRRMNKTLEEIAKAIFKSWFVDFDPVRAKAEGRDTGLPNEIADLFPDSFEDSPLGEIPRGWEAGVMSDISNVTSGKRPKKRSKEKTKEFSIPLYGGGGVMAYVREPTTFQPFLLTGRVGTIGKIFRITEKCWPSDNTLLLFPVKDISLEFQYFMLQRVDFASLNRGSTQPLVTQTDLKKQKMVVPERDVLWQYWQQVHPMFEKIDKNVLQSRSLASLRDTLLPKLISGELRVPDAEKLAEAVL